MLLNCLSLLSLSLLVLYSIKCTKANQCREDVDLVAADIELHLNCTTQTPSVTVVRQSSDHPALLTLNYNCTTKNNSITTGQIYLFNNRQFSGLSVVAEHYQQPWGTQCEFSGCYEVVSLLSTDNFFIPPSVCTVEQPTTDCSTSCDHHSECNEESCKCMTNLPGDEISCLLISCELNGGVCANCTSEGCTCLDGYVITEVKSGLYSCRDIDECAGNSSSCEQECLNTIGSYTCQCTEGYESKNRTCSPTTINGSEYYHFLWLILWLFVSTITIISCIVIVITSTRKYSRSKGNTKVLPMFMTDEMVDIDDALVDPKSHLNVESNEQSTFNLFEPQPSLTTLIPEAGAAGGMYHALDQSLLLYCDEQLSPAPHLTTQSLNRSAPDLHRTFEKSKLVNHFSIPDLHSINSNPVQLHSPRMNYDILLDVSGRSQEHEYIVMS